MSFSPYAFRCSGQHLVIHDLPNKNEDVCTIFGCWTSASRKSVLPIVEQRDHLLNYPTKYEGMEQCVTADRINGYTRVGFDVGQPLNSLSHC